ncbi:hypothetical protein AX14_011851 [Amanita brunnescens Koide BX004]|nr:hypothetical protein AX14_011851 [Amanita brunnescens Koide BX004]
MYRPYEHYRHPHHYYGDEEGEHRHHHEEEDEEEEDEHRHHEEEEDDDDDEHRHHHHHHHHGKHHHHHHHHAEEKVDVQTNVTVDGPKAPDMTVQSAATASAPKAKRDLTYGSNWKRSLANSLGLDDEYFAKRAYADDDFVY